MPPFLNPKVPSPRRIMALVGAHHGIPEDALNLQPEEEPQRLERKGSVMRRTWKKESRSNHLRARRRAFSFEAVCEQELPIILEVNRGTNFVILQSIEENGDCILQFPDSRESVVSRELLKEAYDGNCVFVKKRSRGRERRG